MPSIPHEAPLELLRHNPRLAAVLLGSLGVAVPANATAKMASSDLGASLPIELRADAVVLLSGVDGARLAVVVEVQLRYDMRKRYGWPTYLTQVRAVQRCPAVLLVICPGTATARRCRVPIRTGHPGFDLVPLVIDSATIRNPGDADLRTAGPELVVLAVLIRTLDLGQENSRRLVLTKLADLDDSRFQTYTVFVLNAASEPARQALEAMMTAAPFKNSFVDRLLAEGKAEGRAEGEARLVLRVLAARGLQVPAEIHERVMSCTDASQLETWAERAATADSLDQVFDA